MTCGFNNMDHKKTLGVNMKKVKIDGKNFFVPEPVQKLDTRPEQIGREMEIQMIHAAWLGVQAVLITGTNGVGKSATGCRSR